MKAAFLGAFLLLFPNLTQAAHHRSSSARAHFEKAHACPANGATRGRCPGYIIDHIVPLCAGGPDDPSNMQWQTVADAAAKDRIEDAECRAMKKAPQSAPGAR